MEFISDPHVNDFVHEKRSWKERLFTWPWQPWKALKSVYSPKIYVLGNDRIIMSPQSYRNYIEKIQ